MQSNSEIYFLQVQTGSNQKYLLHTRWKYSWPEYSNQMVQEILLRLQEPQQSVKVSVAYQPL